MNAPTNKFVNRAAVGIRGREIMKQEHGQAMVEYLIVAASLALGLFSIVGLPGATDGRDDSQVTLYRVLSDSQLGYRRSVSVLPYYDPSFAGPQVRVPEGLLR